MLMYAKVIDEEKKEVSVGLGDDINFYESIGMIKQDVDKAYNGRWYLIDYVPKQPLDELKALKREEINQARDNAEQGGFEYMGKIFDSDQVSCQRISCAAQAMSVLTMSAETPTITWTCQDNTTIDLSASELMGLVVALAQWSNSCHEKATALKAQIDACTGKEELDAITWE